MTLDSIAGLFAYVVFVSVMGAGLVHQVWLLATGRPAAPDHAEARTTRIAATQPDGTIMMGTLGVAVVVAGIVRQGQGTGRPHWYFLLAVLPLVVAIGLRVTGPLLLRRIGSAGAPVVDAATRRREPRRIVTGVLFFGGLFGAWTIDQVTPGDPSPWAFLVLVASFVPGSLFVVDTARLVLARRSTTPPATRSTST